MDFLKDLVSTRGVQLLARYGGTGLAALATKYGVTGIDSTATALCVATAVGAVLCAIIDHYSHAQQKAA